MCITDFWNWLSNNATNVIALCALFTTFWQGYISRRHNRLSVVPCLTTWETIVNGYIVFKILNNGIGPARIKSFHIIVDGKKIVGEKLEPHKKCLDIIFADCKFDWYGSYLGVDHMMPAGQEEVLVGIRFVDNTPSEEEFNIRLKRVKVLINYESIYKEKFVYDSVEEMQKQLENAA